MGSELVKLSEYGKSALRIMKSIGPFVIAQSQQVSENFAQHQLRLAQVEAAKQFMLAEAGALVNARAQLRERYFTATEIERIALRRDIEEIECEIRRLQTVNAALEKLPHEPADEAKSDVNPDQIQISGHWLDKFNDFAKAKNEKLRQDLLSSALAMEAQSPGSISPRVLWIIGTMDEYLFHAFAALLDVSTRVGDKYIVPNHQPFNDRPISHCELGREVAIGNLLFILGDLGLIGDVITNELVFPEGTRVLAEYGYEGLGLL